MRLTMKDWLATLFVAVAAGLYALWVSGTAMSGVSARTLGAIVFVLGFAACTSDRDAMADVYGAGARRHAPWAYVVAASLLGAVALLAGVITLVSGGEGMLATLVIAMVVLWVMSTVRQTVTVTEPAEVHTIREPVGKAA